MLPHAQPTRSHLVQNGPEPRPAAPTDAREEFLNAKIVEPGKLEVAVALEVAREHAVQYESVFWILLCVQLISEGKQSYSVESDVSASRGDVSRPVGGFQLLDENIDLLLQGGLEETHRPLCYSLSNNLSLAPVKLLVKAVEHIRRGLCSE